jgi:CRISPR-associated Cas5-like protein
MVWIKATYEFASLFSYRIPDFSSQYALSSILPGPSAIKLAIVSTAIETTGSTKYGEKIFELIKDADIRIRLPSKISSTNVLIKRLKQKKGGKGLETTFGIRGYVHYPEEFDIYINIPDDKVNDVKELLKKVRRFGTNDSLVWCKKIEIENPKEDAICAVENLPKEGRNVFLIPVKDINPEIKFEDVNIYGEKNRKRRRDPFLKKFYLLYNVSKQISRGNWIVYEFD